MKAWRKANPTKEKTYKDRSLELRGDELRAQWRANYSRNADAIRERMRQYKKDNLEKFRIYNARYRALYTGGNFTETEWFKILLDQAMRCYYCKIQSISLEIEHKVPLSRGGFHTASNIVAACKSCNCKKGTLTDIEFLEKSLV